MAKKEKTIVKEKTHTFKIIEYSDGTAIMKRENDGFNSLELLGYMTHMQLDIAKVYAESVKPTVVEKSVINRKTK